MPSAARPRMQTDPGRKLFTSGAPISKKTHLETEGRPTATPPQPYPDLEREVRPAKVRSEVLCRRVQEAEHPLSTLTMGMRKTRLPLKGKHCLDNVTHHLNHLFGNSDDNLDDIQMKRRTTRKPVRWVDWHALLISSWPEAWARIL